MGYKGDFRIKLSVRSFLWINLITSLSAILETGQFQSTESPPPRYIHLNVGGTYYTTSLATLTRDPDSMLATAFGQAQSGIPLAQDETGRYVIDRDGTTFRYVLNFLRGGNLNLPTRYSEYHQLKEEVDFYQLSDMKELLELWRIMNWNDDRGSIFVPQPRSLTNSVTINGTTIRYRLDMYDQNDGPLFVKKFFKERYNELTLGQSDDYIDSTSFQYILYFFNKKGNFMPKSQVELTNLRAAVAKYQVKRLGDLLDQNLLFIPPLRL